MTTIVSVRLSSRTSSASRAVAVGAEAGSRLVEEQDARLGGERDADLERAAVAVGEAGSRRGRVSREADALQHARRLVAARGRRIAADHVEAAGADLGQRQQRRSRAR